MVENEKIWSVQTGLVTKLQGKKDQGAVSIRIYPRKE